MKLCGKCGKIKEVTEFCLTHGKPTGYCKPCQSIYNRNRRLADPVKHRDKKRRWRAANVETVRANKKAWERANPEKVKQYRIKNLYGLSSEEYDALQKECALCGATERLVVDHNHDTGEVRGVLCHKCNLGLGMFNDDTALLFRAIDYLMGVLTEKVRCAINEKLGGRLV